MKAIFSWAAMCSCAVASTIDMQVDTPVTWIDGIGFRHAGFQLATVTEHDLWGECIAQLGDDLPGKAGRARACNAPPARPAVEALRCGCDLACPPIFELTPPAGLFGLPSVVTADVTTPAPVPLPAAGTLGATAALLLASRRVAAVDRLKGFARRFLRWMDETVWGDVVGGAGVFGLGYVLTVIAGALS